MLSLNVLDWFKFNSLKANPDKLQFIVLGANKNKSFSVNVKGINYILLRKSMDWFLDDNGLRHEKVNILSKNEVILPGITTVHELRFNKHTEDLSKRAYFKLHALRKRIRN